jgi:hypothetical protein
MTRYADMGCSERNRHHWDLLREGFEWCPECGELLDCRTEPDTTVVVPFRSPATTVVGDVPPITGDDLLPAG